MSANYEVVLSSLGHPFTTLHSVLHSKEYFEPLSVIKMARSMLRKGRMLAEDEEKIQRCTDFIEKEVEASDLTSSLYSAKILDLNDKSEINSGETRVWRIRRLLELLIMRGPYAYHEFVKALKKEGYDHVVGELQTNCEVHGTTSSLKEGTDNGISDDRLSRIEDLLDELCQRVSILEEGQYVPDISEEDIGYLKEQLSGLKADTLIQIKDLSRENVQKDEKIADLTAQLEEKQKQLQQAEERILELEDRIQELESQCQKYRRDIDHLKKEGGVQADRLQRQERKIQTQHDRLKKQEKKLGEQEKRLMKQEEQMKQSQLENVKKMGEMDIKMTKMASVLESVQSNMVHDDRIRVIGRNVPQQLRNGAKSKRK